MTTRQATILAAVLFGLAHFAGQATDLGLTVQDLDWAEQTIEVRFGGDIEAVRAELDAAASKAEALCAAAERSS